MSQNFSVSKLLISVTLIHFHKSTLTYLFYSNAFVKPFKNNFNTIIWKAIKVFKSLLLTLVVTHYIKQLLLGSNPSWKITQIILNISLLKVLSNYSSFKCTNNMSKRGFHELYSLPSPYLAQIFGGLNTFVTEQVSLQVMWHFWCGSFYHALLISIHELFHQLVIVTTCRSQIKTNCHRLDSNQWRSYDKITSPVNF